jgi:hypothetical protein
MRALLCHSAVGNALSSGEQEGIIARSRNLPHPSGLRPSHPARHQLFTGRCRRLTQKSDSQTTWRRLRPTTKGWYRSYTSAG